MYLAFSYAYRHKLDNKRYIEKRKDKYKLVTLEQEKATQEEITILVSIVLVYSLPLNVHNLLVIFSNSPYM